MSLTANQSLFVVDLTYTAEFDQIDPLIDAHMDWVQAQYDAGLFLASGPKIPRTGGMIIAQAADKATLQALLTTDPFHQNNVADYAVTEFRASTIAEALT